MARNTSHSCGLRSLKITVLNDTVFRSKRPFEEIEERDQPCSKRWCSSSPRLSSPSNGQAPSPAPLLPTSGDCDGSDVDDSVLEPSDEERLDSPTGLSREAEDSLLDDSPETFGLNSHQVGDVCIFVNHAQAARELEEAKKSIHTEPLHPDGPSVCQKTSVSPESKNDPSQPSQNQSGLGLGSNGPLLPEAASVNVEKGSNVSGVIEERSQAGRKTNAGGEKPSSGKASIGQKEQGEQSTSDSVGYTRGELDSAGLQQKAAPSCSSSVGDQRENHVQDSHTREPKRPKCICIKETDLEASKQKYINAVLNHASRREPVIGEINEMLMLMQKVASEYQGHSSQHTTDLTVRNYAKRSKSTTRTLSLSQWVERNGHSIPRFESVPDKFQRSPIPR